MWDGDDEDVYLAIYSEKILPSMKVVKTIISGSVSKLQASWKMPFFYLDWDSGDLSNIASYFANWFSKQY